MKKTYKIETIVEVEVSDEDLKRSIVENGYSEDTDLSTVFDEWVQEVGPSESDIENSELEPKVLDYTLTEIKVVPSTMLEKFLAYDE